MVPQLRLPLIKPLYGSQFMLPDTAAQGDEGEQTDSEHGSGTSFSPTAEDGEVVQTDSEQGTGAFSLAEDGEEQRDSEHGGTPCSPTAEHFRLESFLTPRKHEASGFEDMYSS